MNQPWPAPTMLMTIGIDISVFERDARKAMFLALATSSAVGARPSFVVSFAMSFFEPMVRTCSLLVARRRREL